MVHSRPYHPQSQGKIASSHRALSSKMECDFFKNGEKRSKLGESTTWVPENFKRGTQRSIKYKSPFEVYSARKPSSHTNRAVESEDLVSKELVTNAARCNPTSKDRERRCRRAQDVTPKSGSCSDCTLPSENGG